MTPQQFLNHIKQQEPGPAYLFLGPEPYQRDFCRRALLERALADPEERASGLARHDLEESSLDAVFEDACSLSLFTPRRVLVVSNAEAALPRAKGAEEDGGARSADSSAALARAGSIFRARTRRSSSACGAFTPPFRWWWNSRI
jgi:hypothetical protein